MVMMILKKEANNIERKDENDGNNEFNILYHKLTELTKNKLNYQFNYIIFIFSMCAAIEYPKYVF